MNDQRERYIDEDTMNAEQRAEYMIRAESHRDTEGEQRKAYRVWYAFDYRMRYPTFEKDHKLYLTRKGAEQRQGDLEVFFPAA